MELDTGRVTAGLPALSPSLRFAREKREIKHVRTLAMDAEIARKRDAAVASDGERSRVDYQACVGIPLHATEIMRRLAVLNPSLWFQRHASRPVMQIWARTNGGQRFICGFEAELSPEFEVVLCHEEEHVEGRDRDARLIKVKVADDTIRGWRTVLNRLIRERLISKAGSERMFGTVNSFTWQQAMTGF